MFTPCCSGREPTIAKELGTAGPNPHLSHPCSHKTVYADKRTDNSIERRALNY